jgi:hypothetical protein
MFNNQLLISLPTLGGTLLWIPQAATTDADA